MSTYDSTPEEVAGADVVGPTTDEIQAAVLLGVAALADDDLDAAVELLSIATSCAPDDVDGLVALGIALARRGEVGRAIAALESAVALEPSHFVAHLRLGELYRRARRRPRSREHLVAALEAARSVEERHVVERALAH